MPPLEPRWAWQDVTEAVLPLAGALAALGIMLVILIA